MNILHSARLPGRDRPVHLLAALDERSEDGPPRRLRRRRRRCSWPCSRPGPRPTITQHLWIILPIIPAVVLGVWLSQVPLTAVPQRTALSHAFGGLAAGLVGTAKYFYWFGETGTPKLTTVLG